MRRQTKQRALRSSMFANCFFDALCAVPDSVPLHYRIEYLHKQFNVLKHDESRRKLFSEYEFAKLYGDLFDEFVLAVARKVFTIIPILAYNQDRELVLIIVSYYETIFFREITKRSSRPQEAQEPPAQPQEPPAEQQQEPPAETHEAPAEQPQEPPAETPRPIQTTMTIHPTTEQIFLKNMKFNDSDASDEEEVYSPIEL